MKDKRVAEQEQRLRLRRMALVNQILQLKVEYWRLKVAKIKELEGK